MAALDFVFLACGVTAIVATPVMLVCWFRNYARPKEQRSFPFKSVLFFAVPVVSGLLLGFTGTFIGQLEVLHFLDAVPANATVIVNQQKAKNPAEILAALKELQDLPAHHSSPGKTFSVVITDHKQLVLWVSRDSSDPREYWVFYPKHRITSNNEVGRIKTAVFDSY